jgi:hypothetical protein
VANWISNPIDLSETHTRRLFAQEFVTQLGQSGSATIREMAELPISLFKVPADEGELKQVADIARRLSWIDSPASQDGEWKVSDQGRSLSRPTSLAPGQFIARVLRVADPVRRQATDWIPLVAVVSGALTTTDLVADATTLDAIRALSLAVLVVSLTQQVIGEIRIINATKSWGRLQRSAFYRPVARFYDWTRLVINLLFDGGALVLFGFVIYGTRLGWPIWTVGGAVLLILLISLQLHWRRPLSQVQRRRPR